MAEITKQEQAIVTNLLDAGCDKEQIERFIAFLDCCHADQKKIDCLDYLIYTMNQKQ